MTPHELLNVSAKTLSGDRIVATYNLRCATNDARGLADFLRHEHSLELSASVLPKGFLSESIVGQIESIDASANGNSQCRISYATELASGGFTALMNLLMGNAAYVPTVELVDINLPDTMLKDLKGPRFGANGIRALTGVKRGPLGATALKPLGASAVELARIAGVMANAGLDIVKEDDGISTQTFAPFRERVERCAAAVTEANTRTGGKCLYFPHVSGPLETLAERALFAKSVGAAGVEIMPGHNSFEAIRYLADMEELALPVMAHCAMQGALCRPPHPAMSMPLVFGTLPRLAGADLSIVTSFGGRFNIPIEQCRDVSRALAAHLPHIAAAMPMPGGGVTPDGLEKVYNVFGQDSVFLVSGALFTGKDFSANCRDYMAKVRACENQTREDET